MTIRATISAGGVHATVKYVGIKAIVKTIIGDQSLDGFEFVNTNDTVTLSEVTFVILNKALDDSIAVSDNAVVTYGFGRSFGDSFAFAEAVTSLLEKYKAITDSTAITESARFGVVKAISDTVTLSDSINISHQQVGQFNETPSGNMTLAESISFDMGIPEGDVTTILEQAVFDIDKVEDDIATLSDNYAVELQKVLSDDVGLSESADVVLARVINQSIADSFGFSESVIPELVLAQLRLLGQPTLNKMTLN